MKEVIKEQLKNEIAIKEQGFDKEYTLFIKGIGILILIFHHLTITNLKLEVVTKGIIIALTKVCVALFTILSGYGMTKSYEKNTESNINFVINHLKKIMINYWWVYIPAFFLSFFLHKAGNPIQIYCSENNGFLNFLADFLGLRAIFYTPTLNEAWWYIEIVIINYLLFPILYKCMKKFPIITLIISAIPIVLRKLLKDLPLWLTITDREIYYLLPFLLGIFLADKNILDRITKECKNNRYKILICSIELIIISQFFTLFFRMLGNTLYAFSIILFGIGIKNINKYLNYVLETIGKYSMDIFLIHSFYHGYFTVFFNLITKIPTIILKYTYMIFISLGTSFGLEKSKSISIRIIRKRNKKNIDNI